MSALGLMAPRGFARWPAWQKALLIAPLFLLLAIVVGLKIWAGAQTAPV